MGDPTSSYAAAGIAFGFISARKPPHPATKCFRQGGDTIEGELNSYSDIFINVFNPLDRLCGLVVSVEDYKYRGPGFDLPGTP
jgi:hypothetical protein